MMFEGLRKWWKGETPAALSSALDENAPTPKLGHQLTQQFDIGKLVAQTSELIGNFNPQFVGIREFKLMRLDPDISFADAILRAPIINLKWSVESDDPIIKAFIEAQMRAHYRQMATGASVAIGFGWQAQEKVWKVQDQPVEYLDNDGNLVKIVMPDAWVYKRFKNLAHDTIALLIDEEEDDWGGLEQTALNLSGRRKAGAGRVGTENSLLWSFRRDDVWGDLRGFPKYHEAYESWWWYVAVSLFSNRYFERKGDPGWKAIGEDEVEVGGVKISGLQYLTNLLLEFRNSGVIALPNTRDKDGHLLFDAEEMKTENRGDMFQNRLDALSIKKMRAMWLTDRIGTAAGGGGIGTGEAEVHQDTFFMLAERILTEFLNEVVNKQFVNPLVLYNFGAEKLRDCKTRVVAGGMDEGMRQVLKDLLAQVLQNETTLKNGGSITVAERIDTNSVLERLGIPVLSDQEVEEIADAKKQKAALDDARNLPDPDDDKPLDTEAIRKALEDEGILGTPDPEEEEEEEETDPTSLSTLPKDGFIGIPRAGGGGLTLQLATAHMITEIVKLTATWQIPRDSALDQLKRIGLKEDDAALVLGSAGEGDPPTPSDDPKNVTLPESMKLEIPTPIVNYTAPEVKVDLSQLRVPAPPPAPAAPATAMEFPPELAAMLEALSLGQQLLLKRMDPNDEDEELEIYRDASTGRMAGLRRKKKKKKKKD